MGTKVQMRRGGGGEAGGGAEKPRVQHDDYVHCRSDRSSKVLSGAESVCWVFFFLIAFVGTKKVTARPGMGFDGSAGLGGCLCAVTRGQDKLRRRVETASASAAGGPQGCDVDHQGTRSVRLGYGRVLMTS